MFWKLITRKLKNSHEYILLLPMSYWSAKFGSQGSWPAYLWKDLKLDSAIKINQQVQTNEQVKL